MVGVGDGAALAVFQGPWHREARMAKWSTLEVPAREVPARGGGEPSAAAGLGLPEEVPARRGGDAPRSPARAYGPEDFPGCESFHLPERALEGYEGRLEFWDGATETAWKVAEPTTIFHEGPSRRLVQMATRVEALRGSPIACFGSSDLVRRDAAGRLRWLMQADEVLYLHPERVRLGAKIDVDADPLPEVVLEVDHSTDVRAGKLGIYKESGFPEIWVLVPWEISRRAPGLVIHVRGEYGYAEAPESRAFPGWRAEEVFRALTENPLSAPARDALERVARAMGEREGTRPEDDPFTRSISREAEARGREEGREEGRNEGRVEGRDEGRSEERAASVRAVLRARGIEAALGSPEDRELFGALPVEVLMAAALACSGEADFRRRVWERLGPPPDLSP